MMIPPQTFGSNASTVKSHNLRAVLLMLLRHEHISRVRLAQLTSLSTTTITNLISELLEQGIVAEEGIEKPQRWRGSAEREQLITALHWRPFAAAMAFCGPGARAPGWMRRTD